jgi:hypothetical protein
MATKTIEQVRSALDEMQPPAGELPTINLPSAHHYGISRVALTDRVDVLKKLAKTTEDKGYPKEARVILGDALALEEEVLPEFTAQLEMPLSTAADVSSAIKSALRGLIFKHVQANEDDAIDHRAALGDAIGDKLGEYVLAVAARAFSAGEMSRAMTPQAAAVRALPTLYGE